VRCCAAPRGAEIFDERQARRDLRRYRRRGLHASARRLVETVAGTGDDVLEIGGGIGDVEVELLRLGAARATNVELSPAYEPYARELLVSAGLEDRVERVVGDLVRQPELAGSADVVVLHRVVCCYPDVSGLVGAAAARTKRVLALTFPRDSWWTRFGSRAANLALRLRGLAFRTYVHPPQTIEAVAAAHGLRPGERRRGLLWQLATFERA
jgi:magnesium-protoporphyrin O-methyltransferase